MKSEKATVEDLQVAQDLLDTLTANADGCVGMAANMIGVHKRITLAVGAVFTEVVHEYPDITVHLTLFNAEISEGVPELLEHNDLKWITPSEIPNYNFCPADKDILKMLQNE
jgi:peptide deformylase